MSRSAQKRALPQSFGEFLRSLRAASDLSQAKVGRALGYETPQFISNWERDVSLPPVGTLSALAGIYNVSFKELTELYIHFRKQELEGEIREKLSLLDM